MKRPLALITALALLSGCAGIGSLNEAARPTDLYALTPKSTFDSNLPRINQQIVVEEPTATAGVNTDRIAVFPTPLQVQYFPQARWVTRAPQIVQSLLIQSFENTNKVKAVGASTAGLRADYLIVSDLREFQVHPITTAEGQSGMEVLVMLNVKVVDDWEDQIIASRSFERRIPATSEDMLDVVSAFDQALGKVMREAVMYSIRSINTHAQANPRPAPPSAG